MFIYRNILVPPLARLAAGYSLYHRFDNVWGTTTLDGVKVYNSRLYFYSGGQMRDDKTMKRFIVGLGMGWEEYLRQQDSIDSEITGMWFYLKTDFNWDGSTKGTFPAYDPVDKIDNPTAVELAELMNSTFEVGDKISVSISYGGGLERYLTEHEQEWTIADGQLIATPLNRDRIREILHSKPWYYFANTRHIEYEEGTTQSFVEYSGNPEFDTSESTTFLSEADKPNTRVGVTLTSGTIDPLEEELGSVNTNLGAFALMGDTTVWEPTLDKEGNLKILEERLKTVSTAEGEALEYQYIVEYTYKGCTATSPVVKEMEAYYDHWADQTNNTADTVYKSLLKRVAENPTSTNSLFYKGQLRYDVARVMKKKDFTRLLANLDTDYSVKKASFLERAFAVVIVIVAIVVAIFSCLSGCWGLSGLAAAGAALTMASITLTIGMMLLSAMGGLSAQGLVKQIGAFAQYVGYAAMVAGIGSIISNMGTQAAAEAGKQAALEAGLEAGSEAAVEFAKEAATEYLKNTSVTQIAFDYLKMEVSSMVNSAMSFISGSTTWSSQTVLSAFKSALRLFDTGFSYWKDREQEKYEVESKALDAEIKEMEEAQWEAAYKDIGAYMTKELGKSYDALDEHYLMMRRNSAEGFHDKVETLGYMQ